MNMINHSAENDRYSRLKDVLSEMSTAKNKEMKIDGFVDFEEVRCTHPNEVLSTGPSCPNRCTLDNNMLVSSGDVHCRLSSASTTNAGLTSRTAIKGEVRASDNHVRNPVIYPDLDLLAAFKFISLALNQHCSLGGQGSRKCLSQDILQVLQSWWRIHWLLACVGSIYYCRSK